jgi:outer membrane protein OmpA-like peptidoglycan-associated protein
MLPLVLAALAVVAIVLTPRTPTDEVVVLPSADGHVGTVVVQRGEQRQVLNQAYASSRTGQAGVARLSEQEVRESFGGALQALPARPTSFLLYFNTGTDELTQESRVELAKILEELKRRPVPDIAVIGHTDTVGELEVNDGLSAQRAEKVKGFLVETGIPADRVMTAGRGKRELLVPTGDNIDEPRNRRVEINVR